MPRSVPREWRSDCAAPLPMGLGDMLAQETIRVLARGHMLDMISHLSSRMGLSAVRHESIIQLIKACEPRPLSATGV